MNTTTISRIAIAAKSIVTRIRIDDIPHEVTGNVLENLGNKYNTRYTYYNDMVHDTIENMAMGTLFINCLDVDALEVLANYIEEYLKIISPEN